MIIMVESGRACGIVKWVFSEPYLKITLNFVGRYCTRFLEAHIYLCVVVLTLPLDLFDNFYPCPLQLSECLKEK